MANKKVEVIIPENVRSIVTKYVLHFNIDQTLILDDSQKIPKEDQLTLMMVHFAWGKADEKNKFKLTQNVFSKSPKDLDSISFYQYVEQILPLTDDQDENIKIEKQRQDQYMNLMKTGSGVKLKSDFEKIMKSLALPKAIQDDIFNLQQQQMNMASGNNQDEFSDIQKSLVQLFSSGFIFALPILYKTFINLKKAKKEFVMIFRSSKQQTLEKFVAEFNLFCIGEHPLHNGKNSNAQQRYDGHKNCKNYQIQSNNLLTVYQNEQKSLGLQGVFGEIKKIDQNIEQFYQAQISQQKISIENGEGIHVNMMENFKESCAMAILEDYPTILIDSYDYNVLQIFFDGEQENKVLIRDVVTGEEIQNSEKFLVKISLIDLFKDQEYFIRQIQLLETQRNEDIVKIEKGQQKNQVQGTKSDWQLLKEAPFDEYLRQTILPLLHPAMSLVDIERPDDPITYIAMYVLKNMDKMKIPQPPQPEKVETDQPNVQFQN